MAGRKVANGINQCSKAQSLDIDFEGVVPTNVRSEIVKELVKYILYERGQIPMCYDQMKDSANSGQTKSSTAGDKCRGPASRNPEQLFIQDTDALFNTITEAFANIVPIRRILVILGSSIVSPKDSYVISFPTDFYEGAILSHQTCMKKIFRQLITTDFMGNAKPTGPCTSLFVMFLAPRDCNHQVAKLLPKLSFNEPNRGIRYSINFSFSSVKLANAEISFSDDDAINISGIEALDKSVNDADAQAVDCSTSRVIYETVSRRMDSTASQLHFADATECDDFIWYQASTVVKGLKVSDCK